MVTILGPTASGKTHFAVALAKELNGEIISADSRQVFRGMDIGTGKDLAEYEADGARIPYHLIDILPAGEKYSVYRFQKDFQQAFDQIVKRGKLPILCGGTGLYIESVLRGYRMDDVPPNPALRQALSDKSLAELTEILQTYKTLHNKTDVDTCQRAIRAIEIADYYATHEAENSAQQLQEQVDGPVFGILISRERRREKISKRLSERLQNGMVEEVDGLLKSGVDPEQLISYGLEYKFLTLYLQNELTYDEMFRQLEIAIHQFAKRQMTWFRGMEKRGVRIHWIDYELSMSEKINIAKQCIGSYS